MPLSTLDPQVALVVIDLQKGIVGIDTAHPSAGVVKNSAELAQAFRERGLPVVLVNVNGGAPGRNDAAKNAPARPTRPPTGPRSSPNWTFSRPTSW